MNIQNFITAIKFDKRMTQKGEMINVTVVINDMMYFKGQIKQGKEKSWVEFANAPWKNKEGKWNNNYMAGFLVKDFKDQLEATIFNYYKSGQDYVNQSMCANFNASPLSKVKAPAAQYQQAPPMQQAAPQQFMPQQQITPQNFNQTPPPTGGSWM